MSFRDYFTVINHNKEEYTGRKRIYKFFKTFTDDEFSYSDVLTYFKEYIFHLQNLFTNSYKSIILYVIRKDVYHQILLVSKDTQNNTIKREKFGEDLTINSPFEVFIQVESINIPIQFSTNTPEKVLKPTFKLKEECYPRIFEQIEEKRLYFYTKYIEKSHQTKKEIYKLCIPFLINFQSLYKRERINNNLITKSCYELCLKNKTEEEAIYYCEIDNEGEYIYEVKIYENSNPSISYRYKIKLTITLIYDPSQESDSDIEPEIDNLRVRLQDLSNELEAYQNRSKVTNKCVKSDTCCICLSNPSNIIFTDCGHLCICDSCNEKLTELKCPICRTEITQPRLII